MSKQVIFHIDMNAFFASCEQQDNPSLRGKPIGVGGKPGTRSIISAASYEAKALGVKTAMPSHEAIRVCPKLIIVPPRFRRYQEYSKRLFNIFERFSPDLEVFSIDEVFLKVPQNQCQSMAQIIECAKKIKSLIAREVGEQLTCTIGIAANKRLAKLAGELQKPNGLVWILNQDNLKYQQSLKDAGVLALSQQQVFKNTKVEVLCGIGYRLSRRLRAHGIYTLEDLAKTSFDSLKHIAFPYEKELYLAGLGADLSRVNSYYKMPREKSIGHQYTLPHDVPIYRLNSYLYYLAEKVGHRLRKNNFVCQKVAIYLRATSRQSWGSSRKFNNFIESDQDIFRAANHLIQIGISDGELNASDQIRMPSITAESLVLKNHAPRDIFKTSKDYQKHSITKSIDKIRKQYGLRTIHSGLSLGVKMHDIPDARNPRILTI